MIRSASPGSGWPGSTTVTATSGSASNGSRSSKLAMRASRGTAMRMAPPVPSPESKLSSATASSARQSFGIGQVRHDPKAFQTGTPGNDGKRIVEKRGIAAKFVDDVGGRLLVRFQERHGADKAGNDAARSMSPTRTTGTSAASAKPMFAMSPRRRLISAGLPAPSTRTRSAPPPSRSKLSMTAAEAAA